MRGLAIWCVAMCFWVTVPACCDAASPAQSGNCGYRASGSAIRGGGDMQPTEAEVKERLAEDGCGSQPVDDSDAAAQSLDQIYKSLEERAKQDLEGVPSEPRF